MRQADQTRQTGGSNSNSNSNSERTKTWGCTYSKREEIDLSILRVTQPHNLCLCLCSASERPDFSNSDRIHFNVLQSQLGLFSRSCSNRNDFGKLVVAPTHGKHELRRLCTHLSLLATSPLACLLKHGRSNSTCLVVVVVSPSFKLLICLGTSERTNEWAKKERAPTQPSEDDRYYGSRLSVGKWAEPS